MKILSSSHKSSVRTSAVGSIPSLYVMKALLAISVVALHSPHSLPWIGLPGLMVELFFVVRGVERSVHNDTYAQYPLNR